MNRGANASLWTHLVPFVLIAVGTIVAQLSVALPNAAALGAYLVAGVLLFGASSVYHAAVGTPREESMNKLDHLAIHVQIAGTGIIHMTVLPAIAHGRELGGVSVVSLMKGALVVLAIVGISIRIVRGDRMGRLAFVVYGLMALTVLPALDYPQLFATASMCLTVAALVVYAASAILLFPRDELHGWWHVGVVTGWLLAGAAVVLA